MCNLSVINKIKSCHLFHLLIHYAQFEWYACTMVHHLHMKEFVQSYVQPIGCYFFYGGHTLISSTTPSRFKYLLIWKSSLFNDNVTTNYYYLWHPNSKWGVNNIVKKMKKDFECFFCKLNKQCSWFVRALLCLLSLSLSILLLEFYFLI